MKPEKFPAIALMRGGLGLVFLAVLTGCTNAPIWGAWSKRPSTEQIHAALDRPLAPAQASSYAAVGR